MGYHEAIGQLDAAFAKGGGAEVAGEDSGGERHGVVDQVHKDRRCREAEEELQFNPGSLEEPPEPGQLQV